LEDDYEIGFELVTTGTLTPNAAADLKTIQEQLARDHELSATLGLVDEEKLKTKYDLALDKQDPIIKYDLNLGENKNWDK